MCGIAGVFGPGNVQAMLETLKHRGPDSQGVFYQEPVQLGATRLAILDLKNGDQPMTNQRGTLTVVHNGEIYNFEELRQLLEQKGYTFQTQSDTEVILASYEEWGTECLHRFNGMFAFAIWDSEKRRLMLARDRMGVKPLYWSLVQNRLLFASEAKAILKEFPSSPELEHSFYNFECPLFEKTLFKDIQMLLPGHFLLFDGERLKIEQYWNIPQHSTSKITLEEAVEELHWLICDSVKLRLKSDVPLGVFASGGIDSAILASLSNTKFLYTCNYPLGAPYDESEYWAVLESYLNINGVQVRPQPEDLEQFLQSIIYYLDSPIATASSLSEFMLAKRAAQDVKVVLGGQGADEIFGGYVRYMVMLSENQKDKIFQNYSHLIQFANPAPSGSSFSERYFNLSNRGLRNGLGDFFQPYFSTGRSRIDEMGLCDMDFVLPSLLTMNDRAAAHVGIENRTPFLDYRIVEFAFRLPQQMKIQNGVTKFILREASKGIIPEQIRTRPDKKGLVTPAPLWLNHELRGWASHLSERLHKRGIVWPEPKSRGEFDRYLYSKICLELWFQNFFPDYSS